jgi:hypothetical protein
MVSPPGRGGTEGNEDCPRHGCNPYFAVYRVAGRARFIDVLAQG